MNHIQAIFIKFLMISAVLLAIFAYFEGSTVGGILLMSVIVTGLSYVIGDLFILPRTGNLWAAAADFVLTGALLWILGGLLISPTYPMVYVALATSFIIAVSEIFFHVHLEANVLELDKSREADTFVNARYLAEFAEESAPEEKKRR